MIKYSMKTKDIYLNTTIKYYEKLANELINTYELADMKELHNFLISHLEPHSKVIDIGFGSGRDLAFLKQQGFDIWGIDPSEKFVTYAKNRFYNISHHFIKGKLPHLNIPQELLRSFDAIVSIAVWMHLPKETYSESIKSLCLLLKPYGKIILSYSITPRTNESERFFEDIDRSLLKRLFEQAGYRLIENISTKDGLENREIAWITEVYSYDKF